MTPTPTFASHTLRGGLASHQREALAWLRDRPVALLADATGSGKTAVAAALIAYAFDVEGARRAVWVTEANLIPQALQELNRFLPTLQVNPWPGRSGDQVRVVSVETLTRHVELFLGFGADVGVVDDAAIKGGGPEPAAVTRVMGATRRRLCLTATPVELDATEAYRILRVLGAPDLPDWSVFDSYMQWQDLPYGQERPYATRPEAVELVRQVFGRYVLRRGPEELGLVLPQLQNETSWVSLTAPQQAAYRRADSERSPLVQATKREQACAFALGRSAKAEAAVAMIAADPSLEKVVVYAENLRHLSITERLLDAAGIGWVRVDGPRSRKQRATALEAFKNDPDVRVLLGTKVLERGLDGLQHCGVLFSLGASFNPAREAQRIGRLRRPGSPHHTVRHVTFVSDTRHERAKHETLRRREHEATSLIHGLTGTTPKGPQMDLTPAQVEQLRTSRPWLRKRAQAHGRPIGVVVAEAHDTEFLIDAVDTGHVPELEGIKMALEAYRIVAEVEARAAVVADKHHFAQDFLFGTADEFRAMAASLLRDAETLEALGPSLGVSAAATG